MVDRIEPLILEIRSQKVVFASDLAALYGVSTKALNQAVKRNIDRFPQDFMFQLSTEEKQEVVTNRDHLSKLKFSPTLPYFFTEHGVVMAASVLNSPRAVEVSVFVVRAFVKLRQLVLAHKELAGKLDQLERKVGSHDEAIKQLVAAIRMYLRIVAVCRHPGELDRIAEIVERRIERLLELLFACIVRCDPRVQNSETSLPACRGSRGARERSPNGNRPDCPVC